MKRLRVGISTCPNDTFAFHGLLSGEVRPRGFELDIELADIEELNTRLLCGDYDAAKASFALAIAHTESFGVLAAGSALGRGVGPIVVARRGEQLTASSRVLAPGAHTTAALLWRLFHPDAPEPRHVVFSAILPAVAAGEAELGVCIHEGRFTFREHGLELVEDLGATWEHATGLPLPLGGLLARHDLGPATHTELVRCIRASLALARRDPTAALPTMRRHAQEQSDRVLQQHVELYVTAETDYLSPEARRALTELSTRARTAAIAPAAPPIVLGDA